MKRNWFAPGFAALALAMHSVSIANAESSFMDCAKKEAAKTKILPSKIDIHVETIVLQCDEYVRLDARAYISSNIAPVPSIVSFEYAVMDMLYKLERKQFNLFYVRQILTAQGSK